MLVFAACIVETYCWCVSYYLLTKGFCQLLKKPNKDIDTTRSLVMLQETQFWPYKMTHFLHCMRVLNALYLENN